MLHVTDSNINLENNSVNKNRLCGNKSYKNRQPDLMCRPSNCTIEHEIAYIIKTDTQKKMNFECRTYLRYLSCLSLMKNRYSFNT